jgi:hypothetical protein
VSRRSQTAAEGLLEANDILVDGALERRGCGLLDDRREISAISLYLVRYHGAKTFGRWIDTGSIEPPDGVGKYGREHGVARAFVSSLGLEYAEPGARGPGEGRFNYAIDPAERVFELEGADYMVRLQSKTDACNIGDTGFVVAWDESLGVVLSDRSGVVAVAPIDSVLERIGRSPGSNLIPANLMRVSVENGRIRFIVYFNSVGGMTGDGTPEINFINADCFVAIK